MSAPQEEFPRPRRRASRAPFDIRSIRESADDQSNERNLLLSLLPESVYASLAPHLEPIALTARQVAWRPEARIHAVYFPRSAVFSVLTPLERHSPVESSTVG